MTDSGFILAILGAVFGLILMVYLGGRKPRRRGGEREPGFDPSDLNELSGRMSTIATVYGEGDTVELTRRLQRLIDKQWPVHSIAAAPAREATRIRFIDGTTLLVKGESVRLARLAHERRHHPVRLAASRTDSVGTQLTFVYRGGHFATSLVGFDQAD